MEIKKLNLKWTGKLLTLYISKVKHIMLHHTAHPTWNFMDVHNYHQKSNGWIGIGYNYFIEKDGTIYEGRGMHIGAGATGYNSNSLHICFAGNFESQTPTKEQIEAGKWLISYLLSLCPIGTKVVGHKDVGRTACPGKNFPLNDFKDIRVDNKKERTKELQTLLNEVTNSDLVVDGIYGSLSKKATTNAKIKNGAKGKLVEFTQKQLIRKGYSLPAYGSDGHFGNETHYAVLKFQKAKDLAQDGWVGGDTMAELLK